MFKKVHPIVSYSGTDTESKDLFLLSRNEIKRVFKSIKKDIRKGKYQLFRLSRKGASEITIVKKGSIHMDILNHLIFKPKIKTYIL